VQTLSENYEGSVKKKSFEEELSFIHHNRGKSLKTWGKTIHAFRCVVVRLSFAIHQGARYVSVTAHMLYVCMYVQYVCMYFYDMLCVA